MSEYNDKLNQTIRNAGVVPVIALNDASKAVPLAKALLAGGIPCIEVTFRTAAAEDAIKAIHSSVPEMHLGAGTVITLDQAQRAVAAGARFIVSPGLDENIVHWCQERDIAVFPGVCTASEVQKAIGLGLDTLKFFPAEASGGVNMINNLCGPFPQVKFMTTGGISMVNIAEYAACPHVVAVGGSWMAKSDAIDAQRWDDITARSREAVFAMNGFKLAHFGMNVEKFATADDVASKLALFGMVAKIGGGSTFMDDSIEIMHRDGRGESGHIGFRCFNVERSVNYLSQFGFTIDQSSVGYDAKGNMKVAYMNEHIGGFAIHLVKG